MRKRSRIAACPCWSYQSASSLYTCSAVRMSITAAPPCHCLKPGVIGIIFPRFLYMKQQARTGRAGPMADLPGRTRGQVSRVGTTARLSARQACRSGEAPGGEVVSAGGPTDVVAGSDALQSARARQASAAYPGNHGG